MFNSLLERNVSQMLDNFRRSVDQLFDDFYRPAPVDTELGGTEYTFNPMIESGWSDSNLFLRAVVPGVSEKDVKVSVQNNQLIVEGERKAPEEWSMGANRQMAYGKFYASIPLPDGVDMDRLSCRLHDGVLDIQVPLAEQMKPRQIPIETGDGQKAIAA